MHIAMTVGDMDPRTGGPPQVVAGSAVALARRGHQITIFTRQTEALGSAFKSRFAGLPITVLGFALDCPSRLANSAAMERAFSARVDSIDVLHVHGIWEGHLAKLAAQASKAGKGVFVSSHGMLDRWSMRQSVWKKRLMLALGGTGTMLDRASAVIFGTEEESGEGRAIVQRVPRAIVANGIDSHAFGQAIALLDPQPLLDRFPAMRGWQRTILYFSRIHPKKGLDMLVNAFAQLVDSHPQAGLLVVGIADDEAYLEAIRQVITKQGMEEQVAITTDLTGPDAKVALTLADAFVLPSHQEGFSMAIIEAMAVGKPLLITDKCHMNEVTAWKAGVVVPDTPAGILDGLEQILALEGDALSQFGRNGAAIARERFEWSQIAGQLETLYLQGKSL